MASFPALKTGAFAQFPARKALHFSTEVRNFLDGREQRYRDFGGAKRSWIIELTQLDEAELQAVRSFVEDRRGSFESFNFDDPFTGESVANCRFALDAFESFSEGAHNRRVRLEIMETR